MRASFARPGTAGYSPRRAPSGCEFLVSIRRIDIRREPRDARKMRKWPKKAQLQIRVSAEQKTAIQRAAARAGMDMSAYVLAQVLSVPAMQFRDCAAACAGSESPRFALAELNSLLSGLTAGELREAVAAPPPAGLTPFLANYIAA